MSAIGEPLPTTGALEAPRGSSLAGPTTLVLVGVAVLTLAALVTSGALDLRPLGPWFLADATARLFLVLIDTIFLGIAANVWMRVQAGASTAESSGRTVALWLGFLAAANFAILSNHLVVSWIGLELTTLAAAPLIVRPGEESSRLASWRYFLFSSVGLALTLLGFLCIERSFAGGGVGHGLFVDALLGHRPASPDTWRTLGIALAILGYGTKLGLAPMYMWLPETYDEAPPPVTSLLAAIQFNVALVGLLRVLQVFRPGNEPLVSTVLVGMGLASIALATASLIATGGLRRLIAYASILHAGIIAVGLGVGGGAGYGVLLYAVSNAFIKAMLFLTAGKVEAQYGTKATSEIRGVIKGLPYSGVFLMAGTFALLGFPPFGSFVGELLILSGLVRAGYVLTFATIGFLVTVSFVATGRTVFPMIWGEPTRPGTLAPQTFVAFLPKLIFLVILVILGLYMPAPVSALFRDVAASLGDT